MKPPEKRPARPAATHMSDFVDVMTPPVSRPHRNLGRRRCVASATPGLLRYLDQVKPLLGSSQLPGAEHLVCFGRNGDGYWFVRLGCRGGRVLGDKIQIGGRGRDGHSAAAAEG